LWQTGRKKRNCEKICDGQFCDDRLFRDEPGADRVALILKSLIDRKAYMSVINWAEIYYNTMREQGVETAEKVIGQLKQNPIELVDADQNLTY
jgi:hypothetical protein